jgi:hypothetical protein
MWEIFESKERALHWNSYCLFPHQPVIMLFVMHMTMSISIGLYPKLDLWTANKLHYITQQNHQGGIQLHFSFFL